MLIGFESLPGLMSMPTSRQTSDSKSPVLVELHLVAEEARGPRAVREHLALARRQRGSSPVGAIGASGAAAPNTAASTSSTSYSESSRGQLRVR